MALHSKSAVIGIGVGRAVSNGLSTLIWLTRAGKNIFVCSPFEPSLCLQFRLQFGKKFPLFPKIWNIVKKFQERNSLVLAILNSGQLFSLSFRSLGDA